jgi:P-type Cu2+ transporter
MQMLSAAEQGRGRYVRSADRMARLYAPAVHALASITLVVWMFVTSGNWHQSLTVAIAVLIITCPCALGLAVPVAHVVAASRLFSVGILVKDGSALERLAEITRAAFDKTGTLTTSAPRVEDGPALHGPLRHVIKSLALKSRHPASLALASHLSHVVPIELDRCKEIPGFGITAWQGNNEVRLGRASWVSDVSAQKTEDSGLAFAKAGGLLHQIRMVESPRQGASETLAALMQRGIPVEIISGDHSLPVAQLAAELGVSCFSASFTPADKLARLHHLSQQGEMVLMVGDGLNDAPALAAAHVSMAPASASDIGRTAADFVFLGENLNAVATAHAVARNAAATVKQNFGLAIVYNIFAVPLAMTGYLNPLIAAIAMSTSSLLVIGNSLRLNRVNTKRGFQHSENQTPWQEATKEAAA